MYFHGATPFGRKQFDQPAFGRLTDTKAFVDQTKLS